MQNFAELLWISLTPFYLNQKKKKGIERNQIRCAVIGNLRPADKLLQALGLLFSMTIAPYLLFPL